MTNTSGLNSRAGQEEGYYLVRAKVKAGEVYFFKPSYFTSLISTGRSGHVQVMRSHNHCVDPTLLLRSHTHTQTTLDSVSYSQQKLGISLSEGLEKTYKAKVERIAKQYRVKNRKFRGKLPFFVVPLNLLETLYRDVAHGKQSFLNF